MRLRETHQRASGILSVSLGAVVKFRGHQSQSLSRVLRRIDECSALVCGPPRTSCDTNGLVEEDTNLLSPIASIARASLSPRPFEFGLAAPRFGTTLIRSTRENEDNAESGFSASFI